MGNHSKATNNAAPAYFRLRFWAAPFLVFLGRSDAGGSSSSSTRLRFALPAGLAGAVFAGAGAAPDGPAALTSQHLPTVLHFAALLTGATFRVSIASDGCQVIECDGVGASREEKSPRSVGASLGGFAAS